MDGQHGQKVKRNLKCQLSDEEVSARGQEVSQLLGEKYEAELAKKAAADTHKEKISTIDSRIAKLAKECREKAEYRMVECIYNRDDDLRKVELIRTDTGEQIFHRPLTREELQLRLIPKRDKKKGDDKSAGGDVPS